MIEHSLAGVERLPAEKVKTVRFEDMTTRPGETADELANFAEVQPDDLSDAFSRVLKPEGLPGRSVPVTPEEWESALSIIRPMQVRLGYAK